jgi:hypothetical protein
VSKIREHPPSTLETSLAGSLEGDDKDPRATTINAKKHRWRTTWEVVMKIHEHPPSTQETSTAAPPGPLGGNAGDLGTPTINARNINDGPIGLIGGSAGDPGALTINARNINGRPPGRQ